MIKILELFGGIGSPRKALINLGIPVKAIDYVEIDEKAVKSYNSIFKKDLEYRTQDVVGYNLKPDILIHGSPCQNFSIAGKQEGGYNCSNTKSSLMWETINIINQIGEWKPKIVIWENVKNVLSKHMIHNFNLYLSEMESMGYTNSYEVLNTLDFRLPQHRERVFTISMLNGLKFNFNKLERKAYKPMSEFLEDTKEDKYIVTQPSILKKINNSNSKFKGKIYIIKDYCMTITTKQMRCPNSGVVDLGNGKYRYLTERECRRLQGYDDEDFEAALKSNPSRQGKLNGALYKQAGNSIPVPIFESIFKELFNFMEFKE